MSRKTKRRSREAREPGRHGEGAPDNPEGAYDPGGGLTSPLMDESPGESERRERRAASGHVSGQTTSPIGEERPQSLAAEISAIVDIEGAGRKASPVQEHQKMFLSPTAQRGHEGSSKDFMRRLGQRVTDEGSGAVSDLWTGYGTVDSIAEIEEQMRFDRRKENSSKGKGVYQPSHLNVQDIYNVSYGSSSNDSSEGRSSVRKQLTKLSDPSIAGSPKIEEPDLNIWTVVDRMHHPSKLDDEGTDEFQQRMAASHRH